MSFNKIFVLAASCGLFLALGCAYEPKAATAKSSMEQKTSDEVSASAAREVQGQSFVEVEFKPNSSQLTEKAKNSLRSLVEHSSREGQIDEVLVLSWADSELPSKDKKKLSKSQVDLAARRNEAVKEYIHSLRSVDVDKYNMAEQPNIFSKWFNTRDTRLKNSLMSAGLPTTADDPQYPSKASHSVIITVLK